MSAISSTAAFADPVTESQRAARAVRGLIWLYLILLLFEGALRKWIMPGLSAPLLIIRDPLVLLIYVAASVSGIFPKGKWMTSFWALAFTGAFFGLVADHLDWKVYIFGLRTNFLHLPLIFVMYRAMTYGHIVRMGYWVLLFSIPMTFLVVQQYLAPPDDIINTAAGGMGRQLETSGGKVRASGTFTFVVGIVAFYGLVCGFLINSLLKRRTYPMWLQIAGASGIVIAVATSGSRSALAAILIVIASVVIILLSKPAMMGRVIIALAVLAAAGGVVTQFLVVEQGMDNLVLRFKEAGGGAGIWPRIFGGFLIPFQITGRAPFFGYGLGYGTNAGAALGGTSHFLLGESEWERVIMESGPIIGNLFIVWRLCLLIYLFTVSVRAIQVGNVLPLLLLSAAGPMILNGQFGQPTILGFAVLGGGLCLAATRQEVERPAAPRTPFQPSAAGPPVRARSRYAEILHGNG